MYKFLIIDFDCTFQPEDATDVDCTPAVYLTYEEDESIIVNLINEAKSAWEDTDGSETLQEFIENVIGEQGKHFQYVGSLEVSFKERQKEYVLQNSITYVTI